MASEEVSKLVAILMKEILGKGTEIISEEGLKGITEKKGGLTLERREDKKSWGSQFSSWEYSSSR